MPLDESWNIFQSVLVCVAWHPRHLTTSLLSESLVLPALVLLVSMNQQDRIVVRFAKWRARESFVSVSVFAVNVV